MIWMDLPLRPAELLAIEDKVFSSIGKQAGFPGWQRWMHSSLVDRFCRLSDLHLVLELAHPLETNPTGHWQCGIRMTYIKINKTLGILEVHKIENILSIITLNHLNQCLE